MKHSDPHPPRRRWHHSLRARFILVFVALAFAMSVVFIGGMRSGLGSGWRDVGRPLIADYLARLTADLGSPPDVERARALTAQLPISIRIEGPQVNWASHPERLERGWHRESGDEWFARSTADGHRVAYGLSVLPWGREPPRIVWFVLAMLLVCVLAAYVDVRRMLSPLDDIRSGTERFGRGDFAQPIPQRGRNELGDLALRINTMARDIQGMLDAKRALLLAVSHELRSPLTRARLNAELLPETPESTRERSALLRDLAEMRDLIADLLESERLASPHTALQREPVDAAALVREVAESLPGASACELDLQAGLPPRALDRPRIRLLVRNLLDNALRHSEGAARPPVVSLRAEGEALQLQVRDFGSGVAEAQLAHLAEPFYRTDEARTRAAGGVGLGLYLCRLIAQAHRGSLAARNAEPGLEITVLLN